MRPADSFILTLIVCYLQNPDFHDKLRLGLTAHMSFSVFTFLICRDVCFSTTCLVCTCWFIDGNVLLSASTNIMG